MIDTIATSPLQAKQPAGEVVGGDATAGNGIASRQGCDKLRHFEAKWRWALNEIVARRSKMRHVPTEVTQRILATKYFPSCSTSVRSLGAPKPQVLGNTTIWMRDSRTANKFQVARIGSIGNHGGYSSASFGGDDVSDEPHFQQHCEETQHLAPR